MLLIAKQTRSLLDSYSSKFILLKAFAWGIWSPGVYFNSKLKPIRVFSHLVIQVDDVFEISSSGAKRYLSGLWSLSRVNRLPRRNCFNLVTPNTTAIAFHNMFE